MQKLLTIVVPTYNMQDYLNRCLDSLVVSPELMGQLEVLVINDGSKDNSSAIAREYEAKYPETFRVIDKKNGNYGSCVNRGLAEAQGKYIKVLDADDWFDTDAFKSFLRALNEASSDLVLTSFNIVDATTGMASLAYNPNLEVGKVYNFVECTLDEVGVYMMHAVTYRVELLRSISYVQTEGISYTDTEWVYNPMYAVETMTYNDCNVYQYLMGREGQTMDPRVMVKTINHHEIITKSLIEGVKKNGPEGFARITIERQIQYLLKQVYRTRLVLQDSNAFDRQAMKSFDQYLMAKRPDLYRRMERLLLKPLLPIPYVVYWRLFGCRFPVDAIRNKYRKLRYGTKSN